VSNILISFGTSPKGSSKPFAKAQKAASRAKTASSVSKHLKNTSNYFETLLLITNY